MTGIDRPTLLLVDDRAAERRLLYHALMPEFNVIESGEASDAIARASRGGVDLVLLDLHLPPYEATPDEGIRVLETIRDSAPGLPVVIITGDSDRALALDMVRRGVADLLLKPIDPDVLRVVVARAMERARMERELRELRARLSARPSFGGLIGASPAMRALFARLQRLGETPTPVLLLGESGTGKSALARALHLEGPRASRPFVIVDGAGIPESLLESELFGHVRGAFTGAEDARLGRIQAAAGGTLFLDEIGNLSGGAQAKLLLFLDTHACQPLGSNQSVRVDVRLIAASNRDLVEMVAEGRFRADLLYRMQGTCRRIPPQAERRMDTGPIAESILYPLGKEWGRPGARPDPEALRLLEVNPWPGNVRQLRHALEASLAIAESDILDARNLELPGDARDEGEGGVHALPGKVAGDRDARSGESFTARTSAYEREILADAIARAGGNKAAAARSLGLSENQIRYLCRKHGLA